MKLCIVDTETSGLDHNHHEIVEISGIIQVNGKNVKSFNIKMRPEHPDRISPEALEKQGKTIEDLMSYPDRQKGFDEFMEILDSTVDRFDREDKMYITGYNVGFDKNFISTMFKAHKNSYFGAYFWFEVVDIMAMVCLFKLAGKYHGKNLKLTTACNFFNVPFKEGTAHQAIYDIIQTIKLMNALESRINIT
jgi:DNA polymerase III epsilon subunit-like protein